MNQDEQNLNLLSLFHYILGPLTMVFCSFGLIHLGLGIAMVKGAFSGDKNPPPPGLGWMFVVMGSLVVLCGWTVGILTIIAGRKLRRRKSRIYCMVIAGLECLNMPLGTALGVFTIITLVKPSVIQLFSANAESASPGS